VTRQHELTHLPDDLLHLGTMKPLAPGRQGVGADLDDKPFAGSSSYTQNHHSIWTCSALDITGTRGGLDRLFGGGSECSGASEVDSGYSAVSSTGGDRAMKTTRREFMKTTGAGALGATLVPALVRGQAPGVSGGDVYDVAVVGAGVFGHYFRENLG
jgi:hypothetical protein